VTSRLASVFAHLIRIVPLGYHLTLRWEEPLATFPERHLPSSENIGNQICPLGVRVYVRGVKNAVVRRMPVRLLMPALSIALLTLGSIEMFSQSVQIKLPVSRVHQLAMDDQSENPGNISPDDYYRRGDARRNEIRKLLADGKITSAEDYSDAALIFQHGEKPEDFLFAHILATQALMRGGSADKWIAAATLDRYLQSVNQPQVFGTQYPGDKSTENTPKPQVDPRVLNIQRTQQPYNSKLLPDAVRQDFCVPDLSQQEKNLAIFNTGHRPDGKLMRAPVCSN